MSVCWTSVAVRVFCAKAWLTLLVAMALSSASIFRAIWLSYANGEARRNGLSYEVGDATQLAKPDASFDAVVCTQVAEYIPDVSRALSEAFRVVKRGGRAMFVATDWDAVLWHSETPDRMALILKSWEAHCAHPHLPRSLASVQGSGSMARPCSQSSISNGMMTPTARVWQVSSGISLGARMSFRPKT